MTVDEEINRVPEEICSVCGNETTWSECHYCKICDAALCPECDCDKHNTEENED